MREAEAHMPATFAPDAIPYERDAVERAVRGVLKAAPDEATARRHLTIMNGQQSRGRLLDTPIVRFEEGARSASLSLTYQPDDPDPMHIHVRVEMAG